MSDPVTMMMAAATTTQTVSSYQQGQAADRAASYNAELSRAKGRSDAARIRREGKFNQGKIRANIGKAGVTLSGSALLALSEAAAVNEMDALTTEYNARTQSQMLRRKGREAKRSGMMSASANLLKGTVETLNA